MSTLLTADRGTPGDPRVGDQTRIGIARWAVAGAIATAALILLSLAGSFRAAETIVSAHTIALLTGKQIDTVPSSTVMIVHGSAVTTMLRLTSECSVAYLLGALVAIAAPLALVRRLPVGHTLLAIAGAAAVLVTVNLLRLTLIGVAASSRDASSAFSLAHTYLGSLLTFAGTCVAALVFALIVLRGSRRADASRRRP